MSVALVAAICLVVPMLGAVVMHRRVGDPAAQLAPAAVLAFALVGFIAMRAATL